MNIYVIFINNFNRKMEVIIIKASNLLFFDGFINLLYFGQKGKFLEFGNLSSYVIVI